MDREMVRERILFYTVICLNSILDEHYISLADDCMVRCP